MEIPSLRETSLAFPPQVSNQLADPQGLNAASWIQAGHPVCAEVVRQIKSLSSLHPTSSYFLSLPEF